MDVVALDLVGLKLIRPRVFRDDRGFFLETYNEARYRESGIVDGFVQDNHSRSVAGTVRGLHYQGRPGQAKLIRVAAGKILDVAVDIRRDSPTFGRWTSVELTAEKHEQFYVPIGFAHGFSVLSDTADVLYKVSSAYDAAEEMTLAWDDPDLRVDWRVREPIVSVRDRAGESFANLRQRLGA
jgi:dTDP-4-dehydrorhamnose 3,5-epimerase